MESIELNLTERIKELTNDELRVLTYAFVSGKQISGDNHYVSLPKEYSESIEKILPDETRKVETNEYDNFLINSDIYRLAKKEITSESTRLIRPNGGYAISGGDAIYH